MMWLALGVSSSALPQTPLNLVDFNPDNGRSDVRTPGAFNWPIGTASQFEQTIDGIHWQLKTAGRDRAQLTSGWWKAGYDSGATLTADGVTTVDSGETIQLSLNGLPPGPHTITAWHSSWDIEPHLHPITIQISTSSPIETEQAKPLQVMPTHRVIHDDDAATSHFAFHCKAGQTIILNFRPFDARQRVVLCGLALDVPNPAAQARKHWPAQADEHVPPNPELRWVAPRALMQPKPNDSVKYHIYFGSNRQSVADATVKDSSYLGTTSRLGWAVQADDCLNNYYWRVDCEWMDGHITRGHVRRFKIRELAFPGAEGYGRFAAGGRGGRVLEVTNLEDSGPGSLRAAVDAEGPRTVVFRVSGTIQLRSKLIIRHPYLTIAGQTAPGDGICVRGYTFGCLGTHDVIMRYVRVRVGDEAGETMDGTGFASSDHVIFDHCSISWSIDEAVSSRGAKNITLQRCIVSEALNVAHHKKYKPGTGHSFAGSISGDIGSFHHNLLAHCAGRNWSLAGGLDRGGRYAGRLDLRNNVVFNWQHRTNDGGVKALNLVNNLYLPGPASRVFHLLKPDVGSASDRQQYFVAGNRMEGHFDESGDNWREAVIVSPDQVEAIRLSEPFCEPHVTTHEVHELLENVLGDVGANHSGLDSVDKRILDDVANRRATTEGSRGGLPGIIDSQSDVGGWPELKAAAAPADADHDGLPDAWERHNGLDLLKPDQNERMSGQNVTALETYLSELSSLRTKRS